MSDPARAPGAWGALRPEAGLSPLLLPVVAICALLCGGAIACALRGPQLPGRFVARGAGVDYLTPAGERWREAAIGGAAACAPGPMALTAEDVSAHVVVLDRAANAAIEARQAQIRCLLRSPGATVSGRDERGPRSAPLPARPRTLADLTGELYWTLAMAALAALVAGWVWALRPREVATRLFACNGLSFLVCYALHSVYQARTLGYDTFAFATLHLVNDLSNQCFNLSLLALFLQYPVRLVSGRRAWGLALILPAYVALLARWGRELDRISVISSVAELLSILGLIALQWARTRRRPRERAALRWLALSVLVGISLWVMLIALSRGLGLGGSMIEVHVVALFFPFYIGLAMGVARFYLVELQDWAFRILFFTLAALLLVTIDAALVGLLGLASGPALAAALLGVAFLYLPLRDQLWRRLSRGRGLPPPEMFAAVLDIAFAPAPQRRARWEALLRRLFDPLALGPAEEVRQARIEDGGLRLLLPAVDPAPPLALAGARQGQELFSPSQLALVAQLIALIRAAGSSRDAYERGAAEERRRLAQDLHDDVGARLLSGLTVADERTRPHLHGALSEIRAIAGGMLAEEAPLDRVLADVRGECLRRCEAAGLAVDWPLWPEDAPLVLVDYRLQKALASALREAVSNILRHAGAGRVEVAVELAEGQLRCRVRDDGRGLPEAALSGEAEGHGLQGLSRRVGAAGGRLRLGNGPGGGAEVELSLPLRPP